MQLIINEVTFQIEGFIRSGLGRNVGKLPPAINFKTIENVRWESSREVAEVLQAADELSDFMLFLRPNLQFTDEKLKRQFENDMNAIANQIQPILHTQLETVEFQGISHSQIGLRLPMVVQNFIFIMISYAQELCAKRTYGLNDLMPCQDLVAVYESGHIVCGYEQIGDAGIVVFY